MQRPSLSNLALYATAQELKALKLTRRSYTNVAALTLECKCGSIPAEVSLDVLGQVYSYINETATEQFCMSSIVGGGPLYTVVLGANFHRAYYSVYAYDSRTNSAQVEAKAHSFSKQLAAVKV